MPRLRFTDHALVLQMVERSIETGKPLMLAHDDGVYLCCDALREPSGSCVCAYAVGCDPRNDPDWYDRAHALVGGDDFGIKMALGSSGPSLLAALKRGDRLVVNLSQSAVSVLTESGGGPRSNPPQQTRPARGRGDESPSTNARKEKSDMSTTTKQKSTKKAKPTGERLKKAAQAEIAERIKALDAAQEHEMPSAKEIANTTHPATASPTIAPVAEANAEPTKAAKGKRGGPKAAPGTTAAKGDKAKRPKPSKEAKPKRMSALDAAAIVLKSSKEPLNCDALIEAMSTRKLWVSPNGATPAQTLYAAIVREIKAKGREARFIKSERGHFAINAKKAQA